MLSHFVKSWLLYWAVVALLPVHSLYPSTDLAFALQLAFVLLVATTFVAVHRLLGGRRLPSAGLYEIDGADRVAALALVLSLVGLAALAYDKLVVQGIDYSEGVAFAREEWRRLGEEREGAASSAFSVVGYLFGSTYYAALVIAVTQVRVLSPRARLAILAACFALVMANSALTGGRSNVMLLGAFALAAYSARRGLRWRSLLRDAWQRGLARVLVASALAYSLFIFYERADAGETSALAYAIDFLPFLGVEADDGFRAALGDGPLDSLSAMLVLALSYVCHSFATTAAIVDGPVETKTIIFIHASNILYKLSVAARPDGEWFLVGRFPSVPGALWHQFGIFGFVGGSMAFGALSAAALSWTARRPRHLLPLGLYTMADVTLMLTPALFAGDFLSFPFVAASFAMLAAWPRRRRLRPAATGPAAPRPRESLARHPGR